MQKIISAVVVERLMRLITTKLSAFLKDEENIKKAGKLLTGSDVSGAANPMSKGSLSLVAGLSKYIKYVLIMIITSWSMLIILIFVALYFLFANLN